MVWIFFRELEELGTLSKTMSKQSPIARSDDISKPSCCRSWKTKKFNNVLFGTTLKRSRLIHLMAILILSLQDSLVRTLALQGLEKAWMESEAAFFSRLCAFPKKSSPRSYFLKMCPRSSHEMAYESLQRLPKSGMTVDGALYPLHQLEHTTKGIAGSFWPTPDASARGARKIQKNHHYTLQDAVGSGKLNPKWIEWLMMYPLGWTELSRSATLWYLDKSKSRLKH